MTPGKFLRLVWPDESCGGFYCIAHPFKPQGSDVTVYRHKVFATITEAVTHVAEMEHVADTYFAILPLREEKVWDPEKTDYKTGGKGAWAQRLQSNMLCSKASFFDIDVGPEAGKYPDQRAALQALVDFLGVTKLPMPTLVSSGGGVHVYWHYDVAMPALEWRDLAYQMRQLAEALGFKVDPTRTIDTSSVLRVPETFNWKDRSNPRRVKVLQEGAVTPLPAFQQMVRDALISHGITPEAAPIKAAKPADNPLGVQQEINDFGPPPTMDELAGACNQVKEIIRAHGDPKHPHYGQLDNTAWYRGMICTVRHVEGGDDWIRKLTAMHPRDVADVEAKILQAKQFAPARCETLQQFMPWKDAPCKSCRFFNDPSVPNPIAATRKATVAAQSTLNLTAAQPTPVAGLSMPSPAVLAVLIPNPPKPYERLKAGGISITRKDKDGNESTSTIYAHDLYPLKRLVNNSAKMEQQVWRTVLPRSGAREFTIDADVLYDPRKFAVAMSHNGIYPHKADLPALQDYMVAYISQLQKDLDADQQVDHLGWDDGYRRFIMPDKTFVEGGNIMPTSLTEGARRASQFLTRRGDLQTQVNTLTFYDHPDYIPNQFAILNSLASVIFYATGQHGIVVNMSGDSGASKSTTLYAGAGLWGDPALWPINGTNRGATANARSARITTNANLPTPVDEITHLPVKEAIDLVMSITQPGHRLRLSTDGSEKAQSDSYKSAVMISSANTSLHSLLSTDNAAGTAGSMRVFEMKFMTPRVHTKAQADEFLYQLRQHYGHIGEVFVQFVVKHRVNVENRVRQVMREVDAEAGISASERFWSADIAVVIVAGEIANALGLLRYDVAAIRQWAVKVQVPFMRGVVKEEYREPLAILTDYIAEKHGSIVVIDRATGIGQNTAGQAAAVDKSYSLNTPHGSLLGHYDLHAQTMYLLKQGFKDHCNRVGSSATRILDELAQPKSTPNGARRIVVERNVRRTLGAGTPLAKGQAWCFAVDMTHPDLAGIGPVAVATGGTPTGVMATPGLTLVK